MLKEYLIWIPVLIALNLFASKLSLLNQAGNNRATFVLWLLNLIPLWPIVSRISKNILLDALVYDVLIVLSYAAGLSYFGNKAILPINYVGIGVVIIGLIMVKIN